MQRVQSGAEDASEADNWQCEDGLVDLAPEAEALLCSIFRQMDPHDGGYVSIQLLIECLIHQQGALLQLVNSALGGGSLPMVLTSGEVGGGSSGRFQEGWELHWVACTSWAARLLYLLYHILRDSADATIATSENNSRDGSPDRVCGGDVTWGEFLLLLSISRSDDMSETHVATLLQTLQGGRNGFATLSRAESLSMRRKCLIHDYQWAMLPLALPVEANIACGGSGNSKNPLLPSSWLVNTGTELPLLFNQI